MTDRTLSEQHQKMIDASAISKEVAAARGYFTSESKSELVRLGFSKTQALVPALVIPVHNVHTEIATYQIRPDSPRTNAKGKVRKYETMIGTTMLLDVPPAVRSLLGDPTVPLWITEGARKADSAVTAGLACVGLLGVDGWRGKNAVGGITAIADWECVALNGRTVVIAFDSDIADNAGVRRAADRLKKFLALRKATVQIVLLPEGPNGGKCGLDDYFAAGHTAADLMALIPDSMTRAKEIGPASADRAGPYAVDGGRIVYFKPGRDGDTVVPLCNFDARIASEIMRDDGAEQSLLFRIEGKLDTGVPLASVDVPASQFASMNWTTESWGLRAVVYAGLGARDHLRVAVQSLSRAAERFTFFAHTGWRKIGDRWAYLHAGGAIGQGGSVPDIEVDLPEVLSRFELPAPPAGAALTEAVRASMTLLDVAPDRISGALHAAIFRAALGSTDFAVHESGPTGALKTELAAICQQHWGAGLDARHLPGSWTSTANSLEGVAFAAKDALLVVDDFAPRGSATDVARFHRDADRLIRAQGNRSGRGRMRADGSLRQAKPPRGLILSTGEDVPSGHSVRARCFVLEIGPNDVNTDRLTHLQRVAAEGLLAASLAGFVRWAAPQLDGLQAELIQEAHRWRERSFAHRRTSDLAGSLGAAHGIFRRFAAEVGAITSIEAALLADRIEAALLEGASEQAALQVSEDPVTRFLALLTGAFFAGEAHLADGTDEAEPPDDAVRWGWREHRRPESPYRPDSRTPTWAPLGSRVGWVRGDDVFLEPESTWRIVQRFGDGQREGLSVGSRTLQRRLDEKGLLASKDRDHSTVKVEICGTRRRVIHLRAASLAPMTSAIGANGAIGAKPVESAPQDTFRPDPRPDPHSDAPNNGAGNGAEHASPLAQDAPAPFAPIAPILEGTGGATEKVVIDL